MFLIEAVSARKVYNTNGTAFEALKGIALGMEDGEFIALTGESGSGKSTLLSVIGGIAPPTSGEVVVDGISIYRLDVEKLADFRREYIGFVFQQFHLLSYLTALENVMLPLSVARRSGVRGRALECLSLVGLKEKAGRLPSELSGGEQQRVAVARAIVNEPPIILADEPTGNLDTKSGEGVFNLFERLNREGHTVVIVTHNLALAARTKRTVHLRDGMIVSG